MLLRALSLWIGSSLSPLLSPLAFSPSKERPVPVPAFSRCRDPIPSFFRAFYFPPLRVIFLGLVFFDSGDQRLLVVSIGFYVSPCAFEIFSSQDQRRGGISFFSPAPYSLCWARKVPIFVNFSELAPLPFFFVQTPQTLSARISLESLTALAWTLAAPNFFPLKFCAGLEFGFSSFPARSGSSLFVS